MNNEIHVFCAINDLYAMPLSVMLRSMRQSLSVTTPIVAHIAFSRISGTAIERIEETVEGSQIQINWIQVKDLPLASAKLWGHVSRESYFRLFIGELLPVYIDKVVYLDADLVVLSCISQLWDQKFDGATILAARDISEFSGLVSSPMGVKNYEKLGIPAESVYFNAGVMVINLRKWRHFDIGKRLLAYMGEYFADINYWDQDVLNAVLWNSWRELDYRWNVAAGAVCDYDVLRAPPFDRCEFTRIVGEAFIYHFSTYRKPWHEAYCLTHQDLFIEFFLKTPWVKDPQYVLKHKFFHSPLQVIRGN